MHFKSMRVILYGCETWSIVVRKRPRIIINVREHLNRTEIKQQGKRDAYVTRSFLIRTLHLILLTCLNEQVRNERGT